MPCAMKKGCITSFVPLFWQDRNRDVQNTEHYVQSSQAEQEATQSLENSSCLAHPQEGWKETCRKLQTSVVA